MKGFSGNQSIFNVLWVCLLVLLFWGYYPSLFHVPRGDHLTYLINTLDARGFWDLFVSSVSYNRTKVLDGGDAQLFRPVLHSLLAFEKYFFENNFIWQQLIGIILHIGNTILLWLVALELFKSFSQNGPSFIIKLFLFSLISFFALNPTIMEQVIWTHIHGYLLFIFLFLIAFLLLIGTKKLGWNSFIPIWIILLFASFTYELGQLIGILFGLYLLIWGPFRLLHQKIGIFCLFLFIPILYQLGNYIDYIYFHHGTPPALSYLQFFNTAFSFKSISNSILFLGYTTLHPLIPSLARYSFGPRLIIGDLRGENFNLFGLLSIGITIFIFFLALRGIKTLFSSKNRKNIGLFLLVSLIYSAYLGIIVLGRLNPNKTPEILTNNSYYAYLGFCLFLLCLLIPLNLGFPSFEKSKPKVLRLSLILLCSGFWIINIYNTFTLNKINNDIRKSQSDIWNAANEVRIFIKSQNAPIRVSFDLENSDKVYTWHGVPFTSIFFREYEDNKNPRFIVTIKNGKAHFKSVISDKRRTKSI